MHDAYDSFVRDAIPAAHDLPEFLFTLPELEYPERLNAASELVDRAVAEGDGERLAIVNDACRMTYRELADLSGRIARVLVDREGLIPGNRVLLVGPNSAMLFASWLAILKAGGVAVTVAPLLRAGEVATILRQAKISHAIADMRSLPQLDAASESLGCALCTLVFSGDTGGGALKVLAADVLPLPAHDTGRDDPALIAFTSGTTGEQKGCVQFHRDVLIPADTFARHVLRLTRDDVFTSSAPIAFTFGLGAILIFPLRARATAVTIERAAPAELLVQIARHRVTALFTAPTAYKVMLNLLDSVDLTSLRICVSAGEHMPQLTWQRWFEASGLGIVDGLGATEMMHVFISAAGDDIRPGATGRVVPGYRACVLDPDGVPMTAGTGPLAVQGPTGCRYLADARQAQYVQNGWNLTGDTFRLDEQGYFWYLTRADDMIVSSGYNIGAPEVEEALLLHPDVHECAVVGIACEDRGQIVKAFVVTSASDPDANLVKRLQDHVKATIAPYKYPRVVEFVSELPKTATGKIRRNVLRATESAATMES